MNQLNEAGKLTIDKLFDIASGVITAQLGSSKKKDSYSYSSIAKAASKLIAVFPVLSSRTVSTDTANMVSKYIEQTACQFFILALQQANISTAQSGIEYLKQYHQNLEGNGTGAIISSMQTWIDAYRNGKVTESGSISGSMYNNLIDENSMIDYDQILEADKDLTISSADMRDLMQLMAENANIQFYDTKLNPISINDYIVNEFADGTYHVSIKSMSSLNEGKSGRKGYNNNNNQNNNRNNNSGNTVWTNTGNSADNGKGGLRKEYRDKIGKNKPDPNNPGNYTPSIYTRQELEKMQADADADRKYRDEQRKNDEHKHDREYESKIRHRNDGEHREDRRWTKKERQWKEEDREESKKDKQKKDQEHNEDRAWTNKERQWKEEDREEAKKDKQKKDQEHDEDREWTKKEREWRTQDRAAAARRDSEDSRARSSSGKNVGILRDQDIKKMNDAAPALLVVKFYHSYKDDNGNTVVSNVPTEFIIGVKSHLIPVTTSEILRRIMNDNKDGKKFMTLMRAITGELKASEIILGMSRIKDDVKSCKVKGAYGDTWKLLANRAAAAREQIKQGKRNDFSAITTVLISQADADELFHEENIDISDPKNAMHFMRSYNLMGFVIADDATEVLKIMLDNGSGMFEERAYSMLERDNQDGKYKKLISLMASNK